jgi:hypothetical protein
MPLADLGDRRHVHGVIEAAVAAPGQPVDLSVAGGHLDRRGAVIGSEVIPAGEPRRVAGLADDDGCHDRAHAEDPGKGGAGGLDRRRQLLPGLAHPGVDPAQVLEEVGGQLEAGLGDGP